MRIHFFIPIFWLLYFFDATGSCQEHGQNITYLEALKYVDRDDVDEQQLLGIVEASKDELIRTTLVKVWIERFVKFRSFSRFALLCRRTGISEIIEFTSRHPAVWDSNMAIVPRNTTVPGKRDELHLQGVRARLVMPSHEEHYDTFVFDILFDRSVDLGDIRIVMSGKSPVTPSIELLDAMIVDVGFTQGEDMRASLLRIRNDLITWRERQAVFAWAEQTGRTKDKLLTERVTRYYPGAKPYREGEE